MGVFDGVHLGHQAIIASAVKLAGPAGAPAALTFDPHPDVVLNPRKPLALLTTTEEKLRLLRSLGVRVVIVADFTRGLADMRAEEFVARVLVEQLRARCIFVGEGWRFGAGGKGDVDLLKRSGARCGFRLKVLPSVTVAGGKVSSTRIRRLLCQGRVTAARECLGRWYELTGTVVTGEARGRLLGYPTANLSPSPEKLAPADGVYACYAGIRRLRPAVTNIGRRPTFGAGGPRRIEVHLLEELPFLRARSKCDHDLVGRLLRVVFVERLRAERRFASPEGLVSQMKRDCLRARRVLSALQGP